MLLATILNVYMYNIMYVWLLGELAVVANAVNIWEIIYKNVIAKINWSILRNNFMVKIYLS